MLKTLRKRQLQNAPNNILLFVEHTCHSKQLHLNQGNMPTKISTTSTVPESESFTHLVDILYRRVIWEHVVEGVTVGGCSHSTNCIRSASPNLPQHQTQVVHVTGLQQKT